MPDYSLPPDESDLPQGGQGATVSFRTLYLITAGLKRHGESELDPAAGGSSAEDRAPVVSCLESPASSAAARVSEKALGSRLSGVIR